MPVHPTLIASDGAYARLNDSNSAIHE